MSTAQTNCLVFRPGRSIVPVENPIVTGKSFVCYWLSLRPRVSNNSFVRLGTCTNEGLRNRVLKLVETKTGIWSSYMQVR